MSNDNSQRVTLFVNPDLIKHAKAQAVSVFEPSTLIAIFVYAVLAWGIVKLIRISSGEQQPAE